MEWISTVFALCTSAFMLLQVSTNRSVSKRLKYLEDESAQADAQRSQTDKDLR